MAVDLIGRKNVNGYVNEVVVFGEFDGFHQGVGLWQISAVVEKTFGVTSAKSFSIGYIECIRLLSLSGRNSLRTKTFKEKKDQDQNKPFFHHHKNYITRLLKAKAC